MAARSKAWVYGRSLAGIAGSNATGDIDVCLLRVLCVIRSLSECDREAPTRRRSWPTRGCRAIKTKYTGYVIS